jgi:hypothetical protein
LLRALARGQRKKGEAALAEIIKKIWLKPMNHFYFIHELKLMAIAIAYCVLCFIWCCSGDKKLISFKTE